MPSRHPMLRLVLALVVIVLGLAATRTARAQEDRPDSGEDRRPRIGLALGGGGARGAAHVGVLQILEEMNVPVDYVSGTSMGSIVGALFSIGLSPDEIDAVMQDMDWDDLFSDRPDRTMRNYRRKEDDSAFFLPVEFGMRDRGIVFASGIIAGQKLGFAFRDPNLYLGGHRSFDDLAYPFRPVATDLATGDMFVIERGNLLKAVRASMSIPGVFPPVDWDGHHLVDGYLARNLPVDVVRDMGADIVIAVDVGMLPEETDPDKFSTLVGITEQQGIIQARQNVDVQLPAADIVIHPDLGDIQTRDFKLVPETIPLGRQAALEVAEQLRKLSVSPEQYREHLQRHRMITPDLLVIDRIELVNKSDVDDRAIRRHINQEIGRPLDLERLKSDLVKIFDFGVFELVDFEILRDSQGSTTLRVIANEKFYAPNIVNFGLNYSGGSEGRSYLDARLRVTRLEMNRFGSEWRTDVQIGRTTALGTEFYQPLSWTRVPFASMGLRYRNKYEDWFLGDFNLGELQSKEVTVTPELGLRIFHYGEVRAGIEYGHMKANDRTRLGLYDFDGVRGGYNVELNLDMLDAAVFPTRGYRLRARTFFGSETFGSGLNYTKALVQGSVVTTVSGNTFTLGVRGGSSLGTSLPEFDMFTAGGPENLQGYRPAQFRGQETGVASLAWYRKIKGHPSPYSTSWYVGARLEAGNAWRLREYAGLDDLRYCASASLMISTILGPLSFTYGRAEDGDDTLTMTLGRTASFFD